mmetsp:Transcript_1540/g.2817  ORF Transcript_1540/g.2817 Transcript_1540/m.2817 type:complete len:269 (-) Transcript_1540:76-882(-)
MSWIFPSTRTSPPSSDARTLLGLETPLPEISALPSPSRWMPLTAGIISSLMKFSSSAFVRTLSYSWPSICKSAASSILSPGTPSLAAPRCLLSTLVSLFLLLSTLPRFCSMVNISNSNNWRSILFNSSFEPTFLMNSNWVVWLSLLLHINLLVLNQSLMILYCNSATLSSTSLHCTLLMMFRRCFTLLWALFLSRWIRIRTRALARSRSWYFSGLRARNFRFSSADLALRVRRGKDSAVLVVAGWAFVDFGAFILYCILSSSVIDKQG